LSWFILIVTLGAESARRLALSTKETSRTFQTSWHFRVTEVIENLSFLANESSAYFRSQGSHGRAQIVVSRQGK